MIRLALALVLAAASTGCATIISGTTQEIAIESNVPGATVKSGSQTTQVPGKLSLKRNRRESFEVSAPGYQTRTVSPRREANPAVAVNCLCAGAGLVGLLIDVASGSAYQYPRLLFVRLDPAMRHLVGPGSDPGQPAFVWPTLLEPGQGPAPIEGGLEALPVSEPAPVLLPEELALQKRRGQGDPSGLPAPPLMRLPAAINPPAEVVGTEPAPF
ncbi:MAG: hypothetical protein P1V51_15580 [Deltaproteobacteria bacterium]|nr:hypothetical protein [Deltaproteobacteria bacterium]